MKVASSLAKRKIESFCPLNCKQIKKFRKRKLNYEPLFSSYVFVKVEEENLFLFEQAESVLSFVYWKGKPALIKDEEIEAIKEFIQYHEDIKLERIEVNINSETRNSDAPFYSTSGKILVIKNSTLKVSLPSLGFMMIAEMDDKDRLGSKERSGEKSFQTHLLSHS